MLGAADREFPTQTSIATGGGLDRRPSPWQNVPSKEFWEFPSNPAKYVILTRNPTRGELSQSMRTEWVINADDSRVRRKNNSSRSKSSEIDVLPVANMGTRSTAAAAGRFTTLIAPSREKSLETNPEESESTGWPDSSYCFADDRVRADGSRSQHQHRGDGHLARSAVA